MLKLVSSTRDATARGKSEAVMGIDVDERIGQASGTLGLEREQRDQEQRRIDHGHRTLNIT
jgi:hypothetical protein